MAQLGSDRQRVDGQQRDVHSLEKYQNNGRTLANVELSQQIVARLQAAEQANSSPTAQPDCEVPRSTPPPTSTSLHIGVQTVTDESSGKGNPHKNVQIFEVVAPKPNEDGVHDVLEQENLATLKNVASAIEILNRLKQK